MRQAATSRAFCTRNQTKHHTPSSICRVPTSMTVSNATKLLTCLSLIFGSDIRGSPTVSSTCNTGYSVINCATVPIPPNKPGVSARREASVPSLVELSKKVLFDSFGQFSSPGPARTAFIGVCSQSGAGKRVYEVVGSCRIAWASESASLIRLVEWVTLSQLQILSAPADFIRANASPTNNACVTITVMLAG